MILFTILLIILVILAALAIIVLSLGGTLGFILFGDLIVCILFIVWIMKRLHRKR